MRYLLALLIFFLTTADVFGWTASLAPGVSIKNAILYLIMLALATRFVVRRGWRLELPWVHLWFGVLIAYAMLTWLVAALVIRYKSYSLVASGIDLKANLLDSAVVFLLYLYGAQSLADAKFVVRSVLLAVAAANAIAIGNVAGLFHIGVTTVGIEGNLTGRVFGAFGHANETAALMLFLLPVYVAVTLSSRGAARLLWAVAGAVTATLMVMCGSRGAFVGLAVGGVFGSYLCRRLISWQRAAIVLVTLTAVAVPLVAFVSIEFGDILTTRVMEMIHNPGTSGDERAYIWAPVFDRMMSAPLTMLTGFGWDAYDVMGFFYGAHNTYLLLWFELGIIGLASHLLLIGQLVVTARRAAVHATGEAARHLIAFIYAIIALSGAVIFAQLFRPWLYIWAYTALTMRMAIIVTQTARLEARERQRGRAGVAAAETAAAHAPRALARPRAPRQRTSTP